MTKEEIDDCLYQAGLTAQGCWDELDDYAKEGIYRLCKLVAEKATAELRADIKINQKNLLQKITRGQE